MTCRYVNEELRKCPEVDHVIIVNNAATEKSNEILHHSIPHSEISTGEEYHDTKVIILYNKENQGFARGNNQGARFVDRFIHSKYILFSNDDIVINDNDAISRLIYRRHQDDTIGCFAPKILKTDGSTQGPFAYWSLWKRYSLYIIYPIVMRWAPNIIAKRNEKTTPIVSGFYNTLVGCFFMVELSDFKRAGMMDDRTFLYREEEILAERMKSIGKYSFCEASVSVIHLGGQSSYKNNKRHYNFVNQSVRDSDIIYYHHYKEYPLWQIRLAQKVQQLLCYLFV
ncbi:MAG: glycosyltransferase family 2 protein [Prevotella sp.]|nr:glycosyltransferase family 2 protein [Prevotella sp.]